MRNSETYKALVGFDDGEMTHCDAVEYDDTIWLVPRWIDAGKYRTPERMLRLVQFAHPMFPPASAIYIAVNEPIPHTLYSGELTAALKEKYQLYDRPDFRFEGGRTEK
jgi:hypothetical protein